MPESKGRESGIANRESVVTIESLAAGGAGVGHLEDGMIVFIPRSAPGDRVRLRSLKRHKRHAEALIAEIVSPGPERVEPVCPHFTNDRCGGCQWQHLPAGRQRAAKAAIVGSALRRIGGLDVADPEVVASPRDFGYRTTITLTVRRSSARVIAGFHDYTDPDRVFPLDRCPIARDEVNALWEETRRRLGTLPAGDAVRLKLRVNRDGSSAVAVEGGEEPPGDGWAGAARGTSFLQINEEVAARLHGDVVQQVQSPGRQVARLRILDLYAGAGETAVPLAQAGHDVAMVELDHRGVKEAETRAKSLGVKLRPIVGKVEDHLAKLLPADTVIVNPPRTGLSEVVSRLLGGLETVRLVYVSCDPATLARDLKRMRIAAGDLRLVRAYDMFPQTSHVETLVVAQR